ncbi:MAG: MtrB/PioB family outer membrane beta-barrel protein [Gemmatimonadaceae bacterium]
MRVRTHIFGIAFASLIAAVNPAAAQTPTSPADTITKSPAGMVRKSAADTVKKSAADTANKSAADTTNPAADAAAISAAALAGSSLPSLGPNTVILGGELGYRAFIDEPNRLDLAKFVEYKAVPTGPVLLHLLVGFTGSDSVTVFQLKGTNFGQRDQSVRLRGNSPGVFDVQIRWDRIPHTFSTNARSFGTRPAPNIFVLPNPRPDTATWNPSAPYLPPVRTLWNAVKAAAAFTPSTHWDLRTEYTGIEKSGSRPMGMAMGGPGNNFREILEPIDQTMQDLKFTEGYSNQRFQLIGSYDYSAFLNGFRSVTSDNPLLSTDLATTGSSRGRTALAPSNQAHTGVVNAALSLPYRTRLNASGSYSLWIQNQPFIPATINSAIVADLSQIPQSLGGHSGTSSLYVSGVSRPITPLTLTARFRTFSFRDNVDVQSMPVLIINDRSVAAAEDRDNLPFTRRNADAAGTWRLETVLPLTFSAGYGWENWKRSEARNVADLREGSPHLSLDVGVFDWMSLRSSYTTGRRRIHGEYIQNTTDDQPLHRRFDQADRDRERTNLLATVTPFDQLTMSGSWTIGHDEYPHSAYGLQSDRNNMEEGDISWALTDRFSVDGSLTNERFLTRLRSQYRAGTQLNNPTYDWVANNHDEIRTVSAGFRAAFVPDRFEAGGRVDASRAKFRMATFNPLTPTGGTATQNFNATASDLPEVTQKFQPMMLFATYFVTPEWGTTFRYQTERWAQNDFRTLGLQPSTGGAIFLGNNLNDYNVRYITISVSYRPRLRRVARPAL